MEGLCLIFHDEDFGFFCSPCGDIRVPGKVKLELILLKIFNLVCTCI